MFNQNEKHYEVYRDTISMEYVLLTGKELDYFYDFGFLKQVDDLIIMHDENAWKTILQYLGRPEEEGAILRTPHGDLLVTISDTEEVYSFVNGRRINLDALEEYEIISVRGRSR